MSRAKKVGPGAPHLAPGTEYFYRFIRGNTISMTGRTKTLLVGKTDEISLAVVSCSNHSAGYFHSYAHLAIAEPVDAVLALGDYIYQYGLGGFATEFADQLGRIPEPAHECVTYADYAMRYAQYPRDPDLQAAHAAAPWILTWDDHETTNDSWVGGAQNHDPTRCWLIVLPPLMSDRLNGAPILPTNFG